MVYVYRHWISLKSILIFKCDTYYIREEGIAMKKLLIGLLCLCMVNVVPLGSYAKDIRVTKTFSDVVVDGEYMYFDAYNIDGNNYFKLRDIAYVLNNSNKQFEVVWNGQTNSIDLISGKKYTAVGGEMQDKHYSKPVVVPTSARVYLDGQSINLTAYNINNNNYFKLRDIGKALDFSVEWDEKSENIDIETAYGYFEEENDTYEIIRGVDVSDTSISRISNWATVSSVQQFKYLDEGLAYAYEDDGFLNIVTPNNNLRFEMKYPLLGDVISDEDGNFYVVWGKENESNNATVDTIFISKYSKNGRHIKTTGFVGISTPWGENDSAKTKIPFEAGNSVSIIKDYVLLNYHAKQRYDGHQSDGLIGVDIRDMSKIELKNTTFSGHSFNQKVIYSQLADDFIYASHGDAYSRGFRINNSSGRYGQDAETIFHFYLQPNANYDMYVVNKTFAQLGGLLETSDGVVLVGASAKSISEKAKTEKQNLFVQVFNPKSTKVSDSMFVGGEKRSGATSFDINDNQNSPLTSVTDYGVQWITDYADRDVIAPHAVLADDSVVILWNEKKDDKTEAFYTILSSNGNTIKSPTSLGVGCKLNSNEDPIYHNGTVYWASAYNGRIRINSIELE